MHVINQTQSMLKHSMPPHSEILFHNHLLESLYNMVSYRYSIEMQEIRELWSFPWKNMKRLYSPQLEHWQQRNKPINPAWRINKFVGLNYMRLSDGQFPGIWVTYMLLHN